MTHQEDMGKLADEYYEESRKVFFDNQLDEAAFLVQNAIHLYKQCEEYEKYASALNLMGVIYAATGNETMAIDYYLEGLECAIAHGCDNIMTVFYNNIGTRYHELGEHEKAIDYFIKSVKALENPCCIKEERHDNWSLVTYINLVDSYRQMESYGLAEKYLKLAEYYMAKQNDEYYKYTFLILKCQLYWSIGKKDYIYEHMDELLESGINDKNAPDYLQDMKNLCNLLKDMKEYEYWKCIILDIANYANEQNTIFFKLVLTEMWIDYYQTIGDKQKYIELCVDYVELDKQQKKIANKERAAAIDIKIQLRENEVERKRVEKLSTTDALTGLGNRYLLVQDAEETVKRAAAEQQRIAVGVLDIDCFKQHNDTYGHIKGDACIKKVADILRDTVNEQGGVYRFGGDEFIILLEQGEYAQIEQLAVKIQNQLKKSKIENINSSVIPEVTISQGYACFVPHIRESADKLIEHADCALYYVKKNGRNAYHIIEE